MKIKQILLTGLKVIAAGVAGFLAFIGLGKLTEDAKPVVVQQPVEEQPQQMIMTEFGALPVAQVGRETTGVSIVNTLGKAQSVTGKITSLIQSMSMFAESAVRLFDHDGAQRLNYQASTAMYRDHEPGALDRPGLPPVGSRGVINGQRYERPYDNMIVLY